MLTLATAYDQKSEFGYCEIVSVRSAFVKLIVGANDGCKLPENEFYRKDDNGVSIFVLFVLPVPTQTRV